MLVLVNEYISVIRSLHN